MFNLNDEVLAWCQSVFPSGLERQARIDELADHLHCEVDRLMGEGHSEEEAFRLATELLGQENELSVENAKNLTGLNKQASVLYALCTMNVKALRLLLTPAQASAWIIGVSLFFAGLMLLTSLLQSGGDQSQTWTYIWIAVWWVPYSVLCVVASKKKGDRQCSVEG